ncbi:MAG: hypothetical protein LBM71_05610 [Elusimicrobiota bacterium]|nr:hypothetical protein [Elusimicrobiota bacterium]
MLDYLDYIATSIINFRFNFLDLQNLNFNTPEIPTLDSSNFKIDGLSLQRIIELNFYIKQINYIKLQLGTLLSQNDNLPFHSPCIQNHLASHIFSLEKDKERAKKLFPYFSDCKISQNHNPQIEGMIQGIIELFKMIDKNFKDINLDIKKSSYANEEKIKQLSFEKHIGFSSKTKE